MTITYILKQAGIVNDLKAMKEGLMVLGDMRRTVKGIGGYVADVSRAKQQASKSKILKKIYGHSAKAGEWVHRNPSETMGAAYLAYKHQDKLRNLANKGLAASGAAIQQARRAGAAGKRALGKAKGLLGKAEKYMSENIRRRLYKAKRKGIIDKIKEHPGLYLGAGLGAGVSSGILYHKARKLYRVDKMLNEDKRP